MSLQLSSVQLDPNSRFGLSVKDGRFECSNNTTAVHFCTNDPVYIFVGSKLAELITLAGGKFTNILSNKFFAKCLLVASVILQNQKYCLLYHCYYLTIFSELRLREQK